MSTANGTKSTSSTGRTLIRGGHVFDVASEFGVRDILVEDGVIVRVGHDLDAPGAKTVDASGRIVIPGLVNAHTHSNQTIERGLCDDLPLDTWMVLASYGGAGARLSPRELYVSAMLGAIQMLRNGTTSVLDCARADHEWMGEGLDAITQAYADVGMRANVAAQYSDLDFFSSLPLDLVDGTEHLVRPPRARPDEVLGEVLGYIDRWQGENPRITPMLGPSSLPRCSTDLFTTSADVARDRGLRLQTHLLSAKSQVYVAATRYGTSTVEFLERIGCLGPWASFAHAIWLDDDEIARFAASEAVAVHNPVSNLKLGAGVAPVPALLRAGAAVALGSDGASSNDSQNMWETLKMAALLPRAHEERASWPGALSVLDMCWDGGARAMGAPLGRIAPGHRADLVLLRTSEVFVAPKEQVAYQLAYADMNHAVDTVLVDGTPVVRDGKVLNIDTDAILAEAAELAARVWEGLPDRLTNYERTAPLLQKLEDEVRRRPWSRATGR
ncbi:amidohydrolase [Actinomadura sp. 7K534]|uniref:amidohydrolase family protein n=1 Tax=Actinomadura sp. 7K534 TaxID=2530366 RepID=UPI001049CC2E|nr:amidohydrolase [Actinomadura sp. 7K534]TDB98518.1 amidohydrolase [Actinomadura sp. 7K534]